MPQDRKLLQLVGVITKELKSIDLAWFTTFNLDPLLVENYLVPLLLGAEKPRDIYDYEAMTEQYAASNTDIRFFYDPNALNTTTPKRTSIPIHPISMESFGERYRKGVFHPKVWYFQSKIDVENNSGTVRAFLVVTSANMTISGWAENREAVLVREVRDLGNLRRLRDFFTLTFAAAGLNTKLGEDYVEQCLSPMEKTIGSDGVEENADWEFLFNSPESPSLFIKSFFRGDVKKPSELSVWSPYWAEDIPSILNSVIDMSGLQENMEMRLFPPFVSREQPRFSQKQVESFKKSNFAGCIYKDSEYGDTERFSHAKMWRTNHSFAIGSWNCTHPALDIPSVNGNVVSNMEAGVLVRPSVSEYIPKLTENLSLISIADLKGVPENELRDETELSGRMPPVQVFFDWDTRIYSVLWPEDSKDFPLPDWQISIPGIGVKEVSEVLGKSLFLSPDKVGDLIRSRLCTVRYKDKKDSVYYLYVTESEIEGNRQSMRYTDLDELFLHLQTHATTEDLVRTGGGTINVLEEAISYVDEEAYMEGSLEDRSDVTTSYFVMFRAFYTKGNEIKDVKDVKQLRRSVELAPGNLFEIWDHIKGEIYKKDSEEELEKKLKNQLYSYFLVREFLELLVLSDKKAMAFDVTKKDHHHWYEFFVIMKQDVESILIKLKSIAIYGETGKKEGDAELAFIDKVYSEG